MLQEFHLSITALGSNRYLVRTEDTVDGVPVAEVVVDWPVADWLKRSQPAMDDPILGLLQGRSPRQGENGDTLVDLGKELYEALFQSEQIRESWHFAQGIAHHHHQVLRLRLGFKDSRLQRLPWEVLHNKGRPLATRTTLTFARYFATSLVEPQRAPRLPGGTDPLRVLMVVSSPDDQARLNLRQEVAHIQQVLQGPEPNHGPVEITVLEQPDRSTLTQALEQGTHQVLHYAGHSDFGETGGDLHLVNQHTGLTEKLSGEDLAGLLVNNNVYLAVFNSCRSGQLLGDDAEMDWRQQNLVQALVTRGVPSVIAMAERIPDQVAIAFTQLLYTNIKRGLPIDLSLGRTRQGLLSAFGSDNHYWALPVLYLQPGFDGFLTERDRAAAGQLDPWDTGDGWLASPGEAGLETGEGVSLRAEGGDAALPPAVTPEGLAPTAPPPSGESKPEAAAPPPEPQETPETQETQETQETPELIDAKVADLVAQLSQPAPARTAPEDAPPLAGAGETLLPDDSLKQGLDIYGVLPPNPHLFPAAPAAGSAPSRQPGIPPLPEQERGIPAYSRFAAAPEDSHRKSTWSPWLVWLVLGGLATAASLGVATIALVQRDTLPLSEPPPGVAVADPVVLRNQAQSALEAGDLTTAEQRLMQLLDAQVQAQAQGGDTVGLNRQVLTLVAPYEDPRLDWVAGRAHWQIYRLEVGETLAQAQSAEAVAALQGAAAAWEALVEARPSSPEGLVALGFARYAQGQVDEAISLWERAVEADLNQRSRQPEPATAPLQEAIALHAYGGLMVAHADIAQQDLDPATAESQWVVARNYWKDWLRLDPQGAIAPQTLANAIGGSSGPQYEWLWTVPMLEQWATAEQNLASPQIPERE